MTTDAAETSRSRRKLRRLLDGVVFAWALSSTTALVAIAVGDPSAGPWPRSTELVYITAVLAGFLAALVVAWARSRLRRLGAALEDERTAATHSTSMAAALIAAFVVQMLVIFGLDISAMALAIFTIAAAMVAYSACRLWLNWER